MRALTTLARIGWSSAVLSVTLAAVATRGTAQTPPRPPDGSAPVTPTAFPALVNAEDVRQALMEAYPPMLRDAGVGGAPRVWMHIDDDGAVIDARIYESSAVEGLDEAALEVARVMRFDPARSGADPVAMWVLLPIRFAVVR